MKLLLIFNSAYSKSEVVKTRGIVENKSGSTCIGLSHVRVKAERQVFQNG